MRYANLWGISAYQFGESCLNMEDYAAKAERLGYGALGLADKDSLFAWPSFFSACQKHNLKPLAGVQLELSHPSGVKRAVVYVADEKGYENLCLLFSLKKQRFLTDDLEGKTEGLVLVFPQDCFRDPESDTRIFADWAKIFPETFLGTCIRERSDLEKAKAFREFSASHSYKTIAFPQVRYLGKKGEFLLQVVRSERDKVQLTPEQLKDKDKGGPDFLLSPKVCSELYTEDEIENSYLLAEKSTFNLFGKKRGRLLSFENSQEKDNEVLKEEALKSFKDHGLLGRPDYEARFKKEYSVITKMGFSSYFLIVSDYVKQAKAMGIKVGPGRGSACGCLFAYLLDITEVDPLKYGLSFERFLNPKRVTMPDIDIDFEDGRRDEIPEYLARKYGEKRVCKIVTFHTYKARSAFNCAGKALGMPDTKIAGFLRYVPKTGSVTLTKALEQNERLRELSQDPYYSKAVELAEHIEGLPTDTSNHPAGIILNDTDIFPQVPLSEGKTGIAEYEYPVLESLGFLKVDLLSLHYLTLIKNIEEKIRAAGKEVPDYQAVKDDISVYHTICDLNLLLVFQLDGEGIKRAIKEVRPTSFDDLVALLALYRPGPMENIPLYAERKRTGKIPSTGYPALDSILKDTYGIIIYQEQILRIVHELAGMDLGEADLLRRAISKKDQGKMASYANAFVKGCVANGVSESDARGIWGLILRFADYGFNKSHTVAYALVTFATAYLKTRFPEEFYSVALKEISTAAPEFRRLERELRGHKISVNPISVQESSKEDIIINGRMSLGFNRARSIPDALADAIVKNRGQGYESLASFILKVQPDFPLDRRALTALADSGALDCFGYSRSTIIDHADDLVSFAQFGLDPSMFPVIEKTKPDLTIIAKEFIRELDCVGVSYGHNLRKLFGELPKGYSVGVVCDAPGQSNLVSLVNAYGKMDFSFPRGINPKIYDIVAFRIDLKSKTRFRRYYDVDDVRILTEEDRKD